MPPTAPTSSTAAGSAQAVFSFVTARPATLANKPICKDCRMEVDPMKPGTRLTKKSVQQYQCSRCNTKCVLMNRMCGSWPTDEFLELSAEQQVEFYRTPGGSKDFKKKYVETLVNNYVTKKREYVTGEFQPLSYWKEQGYDIDRIARNTGPENIKEHPQLGLTYRVLIEASQDMNEQYMMRSQIMQKLATKKTTKGLASGQTTMDSFRMAAPAAATGGEGLEVASSSGTSSSSSSSSSSKKGRGKKSNKKQQKQKKKDAQKKKDDAKRKKMEKDAQKAKQKEEKAKAAAEKALTKANRKVQQQSLNLCVRAIGKLQPVMLSLKELLFEKNGTPKSALSCVPGTIRAEALASFQKLQAMYSQCQERMTNVDAVLTFSADEVRDVAAQGTENHVALSKFKELLA